MAVPVGSEGRGIAPLRQGEERDRGGADAEDPVTLRGARSSESRNGSAD